MTPTVRILGTHGVPAAYGGFETAAENVGRHLRDCGWRVIVYCQEDGASGLRHDMWDGMERVLIGESKPGWRGTSSFDLSSIRHAMAEYVSGEVWLTFGYNTGVLDIVPRLRGIPNVINMDGMEWTRARWGLIKQAILLANERCAGLAGNVLIADHPHIARYLRQHFGARRVTTVTYGAHEVISAPTGRVADLGLTPGRYATLVCRPIPENSVLEIVTAWSRRRRGMPLVVVGPFDEEDSYRRAIRAAASAEVVFPGPIFDQDRLRAVRFYSTMYLHGHTVGGTNPSLVEAMGSGNPVVAHDNVYNRWVAGCDQAFFRGSEDLAETLDDLVTDAHRLRAMGTAARARYREEFTWEHIGSQYDAVLRRCLGGHTMNVSGQNEEGIRA